MWYLLIGLMVMMMAAMMLAGRWMMMTMKAQSTSFGEILSKAMSDSLAAMGASQKESLTHLFPISTPGPVEQILNAPLEPASLTFEEEWGMLPPSMRDQMAREEWETAMSAPEADPMASFDPRAPVRDPTKLPSEGSEIWSPTTYGLDDANR
jgi:hypothetical protein